MVISVDLGYLDGDEIEVSLDPYVAANLDPGDPVTVRDGDVELEATISEIDRDSGRTVLELA